MQNDRPILGIVLMLGFCLTAPMGDAVAKLLSGSVPMGQVLIWRFGLQAAVLIPLVWYLGCAWRLSGRHLRLAALRTILHILGIALMFAALRHLPLADAVAIVFVLPFFMLVLGHLVLGEEVGRNRLLGCLFGFCGTLLIVQPSFIAVGWAALLPVLVAANFAVFMLISRQLAPATDPVGLQAVSGVMAVILIAPAMVLGSFWPMPALDLTPPSTFEIGLLIALGAFGTMAHLLMTWALRFAPSATLAPMHYLEIPFATLLGLFVFGEVPNGLAAIGIAMTMAAGLYIILCERATARRLAREVASSTPA